MIKTPIAACLMATALAAAPAFAQTSSSSSTDRPTATGSGSTTSGSPAMNPGAGAGASSTSGSSGSTMGSSGSSSSSGSPAMAGANRGNVVERMQPGQFMSSKLVGTTVYGANNERVGDVNDVLLDRDGRAHALIIGVGGFLGIGEKDVAVPFNAVEFSSGAMPSSTAGTTAGTTGTTATSGTASTTGSAGAMRNDGAPVRIILRMTRDQLNAAPQFQRMSSTGADSTMGAGTRTNNPPSGTTTGTSANPATGTGTTR